MQDEFDDVQKRLWFIQQVVGPDDIYEFADILLKMNYLMATSLHEFTNLETVFEINPEVRQAMNNLMMFRLRMLHKDTRVLELEKFDLSN